MFSDYSLNASQDVMGHTPPPSVATVRSNLKYSPAKQSSMPLHPPTPQVVCPPATSTHAPPNPFLATPSHKVAAGPSSLDTSMWVNKNQPSQNKFALKPSALGDVLNTSLEGLNISSTKRMNDSRNAFLSRTNIIGGNLNNNGMVLRSQQARFTPNTSGIAQSSWVAGGYWGSPSKNKRVPSASPNSIPFMMPNNEPVPPSRPSSQSSGFVSHGSDSHSSNEHHAAFGSSGGLLRPSDSDRVSVVSEPPFVWNFEGCETSSQASQNTEFNSATSVTGSVRRRIACPSSVNSYAATDGMTGAPSVFSASSSLYSQQANANCRPKYDDIHMMRALSRLSQHDLSDDNLSVLSSKLLTANNAGNASTLRNPWVTFILGMSVMANGFLILILHKNGTFAELMR